MDQFKAFVFEGGGTTAFGTFGAVEEFDERKLVDSVKFFIGSSSGSFIAAALGCNVCVKDIKNILLTTDFSKFLDNDWGICKDAYRFFTKYGWYKGEYIENWYGSIMKTYCGSEEFTFLDAYNKTGKIMVITATDLTKGEIIYMNKDTTPHLPIKKAIRRSSSLPLIFKPDYSIENNDEEYDNTQLQRCYVDGGLLDNYPIYYFDDILSHEQIVGFRLMSSTELNEITNPYINYNNPKPPSSFHDLLMRVLIMIVNKNFKIHISEKDWNRTVKIDIQDHSPVNFNLSQNDKDFMIQQGKRAAIQFLENFDKRRMNLQI